MGIQELVRMSNNYVKVKVCDRRPRIGNKYCVLLALLFVLLASSCSGGNQPATPANSVQVDEESGGSQPAAPANPVQVGEEFQDGDWMFTVLNSSKETASHVSVTDEGGVKEVLTQTVIVLIKASYVGKADAAVISVDNFTFVVNNEEHKPQRWQIGDRKIGMPLLHNIETDQFELRVIPGQSKEIWLASPEFPGDVEGGFKLHVRGDLTGKGTFVDLIMQ